MITFEKWWVDSPKGWTSTREIAETAWYACAARYEAKCDSLSAQCELLRKENTRLQRGMERVERLANEPLMRRARNRE